jgi:ABC-type sugar transport system permease subunit
MSTATGPLFEVVGREDTRPPVAGRPARPWRLLAMLAPAAVLVGLVLVVPLLATVLASLRVEGSGFGPGNYVRVLGDPQVRHAVANSLRWLAIAPLVCLVGFGFAWLCRDMRWSRAFLVGVVAAPMAVSALVAGMTFRLMFDPQPDRGTVTALVLAVQDWVGRAPELPGARPADTTLTLATSPPGRCPSARPCTSPSPASRTRPARRTRPGRCRGPGRTRWRAW